MSSGSHWKCPEGHLLFPIKVSGGISSDVVTDGKGVRRSFWEFLFFVYSNYIKELFLCQSSAAKYKCHFSYPASKQTVSFKWLLTLIMKYCFTPTESKMVAIIILLQRAYKSINRGSEWTNCWLKSQTHQVLADNQSHLFRKSRELPNMLTLALPFYIIWLWQQ